MVLLKKGVLSGSRTEAYSNIADSRAELLAGKASGTGTEADIAKNALTSMGLEEVGGGKGFHKEAIARKLGGGDTKKALHERSRTRHLGSSILTKAKERNR